VKYIAFFEEISLSEVPVFGGKNASLGQMVRDLSSQGITVPGGFATTANAYREHLEKNGLLPEIRRQLELLEDVSNLDALNQASMQIQAVIMSKRLPGPIEEEIKQAYQLLSQRYTATEPCDVAVRSSATAEDLPKASFAGQQETFLHIQGEDNVLEAVLRCMASLFTERAIVYRFQQGIDDLDVAISVGIQKMVRSDLASAGVMFTIDPESGHRDVVSITATYGLGELLVQGAVDPDEYVVHKPTLEKGFSSLIRKFIGAKQEKLVYQEPSESPLKKFTDFFGAGTGALRIGSIVETAYNLANPLLGLKRKVCSDSEKTSLVLSDQEILELARMGVKIEHFYSERAGHWMPMDIEWAKDGIDGKIYIVQARPETVHSQKIHEQKVVAYHFSTQPDQASQLVEGQAVGNAIVSGRARVINSLFEARDFINGDILVTDMTDPDWMPLLKRAAAVVTNRGGRTCHAAIVSREMGIPAVIGSEYATTKILDGEMITLDCSKGSHGVVYRGAWGFETQEIIVSSLKTPTLKVLINIGDPDQALRLSLLPVQGVGLARLEFIISSIIGVHPMACATPEKVTDQKIREQISQRLGVQDPAQWADLFVDLLAESIGTIAAAFYPRPVVVRSTDFKSNEYRNLLGGSYFEPSEENPMLGFRGAARYVKAEYAPAFALECRALKRAREVFGMENIKILVPFVRSVQEAQAVIELFEEKGLVRGAGGLEILMMIEIPANIFELERYAPSFDGFSIGSNDLTQLALGVDRDSPLISHLYDEQNDAVIALLDMAIQKAGSLKKPIGICGQAPSDYPELTRHLIAAGITSISLTADAVIPFVAGLNEKS